MRLRSTEFMVQQGRISQKIRRTHIQEESERRRKILANKNLKRNKLLRLGYGFIEKTGDESFPTK